MQQPRLVERTLSSDVYHRPGDQIVHQSWKHLSAHVTHSHTYNGVRNSSLGFAEELVTTVEYFYLQCQIVRVCEGFILLLGFVTGRIQLSFPEFTVLAPEENV